MSGSVLTGLAEPGRRRVILDAAERLIGSTYDLPDADPTDVAALPKVLDALADAVDRLVENAAPDRPTTAVRWPRARPAITPA